MINLRNNSIQQKFLWLQINKCSTSTHQKKKINDGFMERPDPQSIDRDYIGPPDKSSNLRPILRHKPQNETFAQQQLRERRLEVQEWNQNFWTGHNKRFFEDKAEFIRLNKRPDQDTISADDMSKFYKYFLDKNWKIHVFYNISWYLKNFDLLFMALKVNIESFYLKVRGKK